MTTSQRIGFFGLDRQYATLKDELLDASDQALRGGIWADGEFTQTLESTIPTLLSWKLLGKENIEAVTVHSGTQALEIIGKYHVAKHEMNSATYGMPNFKILIPNLTYRATLNAFLSNPAFTPQLGDTDQNGLLIENLDTDFVCHVGLYGNASRRFYKKKVIIDGAQHWLNSDTLGAGMAISFDPTKNLSSSGNGGAIVTYDADLARFARRYKNNNAHRPPGYDKIFGATNSKMSEQDCAHVLVKTKYIENWQQRRKQIREYYLNRFVNLPIRCLSRDIENHMDQKFVIQVEKRNDLFAYLKKNKIDVKIHYSEALSELEESKSLVKPDFLSTSVILAKQVLSLPIYPELLDSEVEYIAQKICSFCKNNK